MAVRHRPLNQKPSKTKQVIKSLISGVVYVLELWLILICLLLNGFFSVIEKTVENIVEQSSHNILELFETN